MVHFQVGAESQAAKASHRPVSKSVALRSAALIVVSHVQPIHCWGVRIDTCWLHHEVISYSISKVDSSVSTSATSVLFKFVDWTEL